MLLQNTQTRISYFKLCSRSLGIFRATQIKNDAFKVLQETIWGKKDSTK